MDLEAIIFIGAGGLVAGHFIKEYVKSGSYNYNNLYRRQLPNIKNVFQREYEETTIYEREKRYDLEKGLAIVEAMQEGHKIAVFRGLPHVLAIAYKYQMKEILDPEDPELMTYNERKRRDKELKKKK